jgi:hypothetical protein
MYFIQRYVLGARSKVNGTHHNRREWPNGSRPSEVDPIIGVEVVVTGGVGVGCGEGIGSGTKVGDNPVPPIPDIA